MNNIIKIGRKHGVSLKEFDAMVFVKGLEHGFVQTKETEEGKLLLYNKEFFSLTIETRRFLLLRELMGLNTKLNPNLVEFSPIELAIEIDWMAGLQLDCFNPAEPAIRALEELSQLSLGAEEQLDIQERLTNLYSELLSESEVYELIHQVFNDDSNSDDAYEASWNGAED